MRDGTEVFLCQSSVLFVFFEKAQNSGSTDLISLFTGD